MLTTGWPIYFTSGCWLYFAISCVSCSTLRLRAFAMRGICQAAACGVMLLSSPLADAVTSSTGTFVLASGLAARNAATRAAICVYPAPGY